jgi:hypothetical protein
MPCPHADKTSSIMEKLKKAKGKLIISRTRIIHLFKIEATRIPTTMNIGAVPANIAMIIDIIIALVP